MINKMYFSFSIFFASYALLFVISSTESASNYYGKFIGPLKSYHHGLGGDVYVVDSRTLHIRNFNYDGEGPAGYFYVSNGKAPNESGTKIRDERGSIAPLKKYRKKHITLTLPEGKTVTSIKHFYVWCDEFAVNFGDVKIPKNLDFPKPQKIGNLKGVHAVSSDNIVVVDAQTLLIPSFSYDGEAPDAKFWVGSGNSPSPQGVRVPDENGKEEPLRKYIKKTIVLTLPGDLTVFDIGFFGIWCEAFTVDFGHIQIPKNLNVPPSLKMLGVSPQSKLNCEILHDELAFEVRWAVAGDSIVIQLVAKLEKGEYMSFGVSGQIDKNTMVGGDVVVSWIDHETLNGYAYDYYLDAKSQCAGNRGSCPDTKLRASTESIRLLNAALVNGYSIVTYQRPLRAHDEFDLPIYTNGSQAIIWAIGPLNSLQEVSYHSITSKLTTLIDFGRPPQWNCPIPESDATIADSENNERYNEPAYTTSEKYQVHTETSVRTRVTEHKKEPEPTKTTVSKKVEATPAPVKREKPWDIPPIQCNEPEDGVYYAQMGPTGGKRGYSAITGHVGWGISWYINGLLIPEINVVRGRTYTFVVEGGLDPEIPAKYHPFYITDDPVGGFVYKTPEEKAKIQLFAGVTQNKDGEYVPTGIGRLCNWTPDPDQPPADEFASFGAYQRTLSLVCDHGEPGVIQWTPDENTPDTVYYQCFSHRYLGWKINVHDTCDKEEAESEQVTSIVRSDSEPDQDELISNPSIQVITRVKPANASLFNDIIQPDLRKDTKNNIILEQGQYKDGLKNEFAQSDRFILQDPYMPPPPYQKNFDYQSMQSTEPMREIKPVNEKIEYIPKPQDIPFKNYNPYFINNTAPQVAYIPTNMLKYNKHHFKEPYALPTNMKSAMFADAPYKYQIPPAMHIHVIKHGEPPVDDMVPAMSKPYPVGRPYRHSVVIKKPIHKQKPPYAHVRVNKVPKQSVEQQVASSNSVKSVLPPAIRNVVPKIPSNIPAHVYPPISKKSHAPHVSTRKKEEPPVKQYLINKVEEHPDNHKYPQGAQGGFNPSSIVIESGFKPIIPNIENQNVAQDRMSEDVEDYVEQDPPKDIGVENNNETVSDDHSKNPFEGKEPELFEPIFIPSPVINEQHRKKKPINEPGMKVKLHKPGQPNIAYIWPNEEDSANVPVKQPSYFNYYAVDTVSSPIYKQYEKNESPVQTENLIDNVVYQIPKQTSSSHTYKVTEFHDNVHPEVSDINNSTEKIVQSEDADKIPSNHKIKYIPVSYNPNKNSEDDKFIINIPDGQSTESSNSTKS